MRYLKQNTDQYVTVGPLIDKTDGITTKDDATVTNLVYLLSISTQASASTHVTGTCSATASNDYGCAAIGHNGMYDIKLPDADLNFVGSCTLCITYPTAYLPVWHEFQVVPANVWDSMMGTDLLDVSLVQILGTALTETAGQIAAAFKKFFDKATPTGTINSLPDAVAGANGGLPTTNGTKVSQTVDLTAGQSIACSDKTGFSLAATGADLILKSSTFIQAIVAAINEFATYGLTALNTLLVTTGIKAASIPAATLAASQHVIVDSGTITTLTGHTAQTGDCYAIINGDHGLVSIQDDIDRILAATSGAGVVTWTYTVTDSISGLPIADVLVWVTTDSAGTNTIASGLTNAYGIATFYLDAGTVYVWRSKAGYDFTNPDTETVS